MGELIKKVKYYREQITGIIFLSAWLVGYISVFEGERAALHQMTFLLNAGYDEKRAVIEGPLYNLAKMAGSVTPANSTLYVIGPETEADREYLLHKLNYYLYPRKTTLALPYKIRTEEMLGSNYILLSIPYESHLVGLLSNIESNMSKQPFFKRVYRDAGPSEYTVIYRVEK